MIWKHIGMNIVIYLYEVVYHCGEVMVYCYSVVEMKVCLMSAVPQREFGMADVGQNLRI